LSESPRRLSELLRGAGLRPRAAVEPDPPIGGTCLDSRRVRPGELFFAIPGFERDGEAFVPQAVERGARAVVAGSSRPDWLDDAVAWVTLDDPRHAAGLLSREFYGRPDEALTLVGVTGTNGKTTVTYLVEAIAGASGKSAGRIGTVGYAYGGTERRAERTTPEAPDFYRLLAEMRDAGVDLVAVEVSSHALALSRIAGACFSVGAFLNLSRDHLDFHGDEAAYFEAKARMFDSLEPENSAVLPAGTPLGETLARRTRARVLTFGTLKGADLRLRDEHLTLEGSSAILETPSGALPVRTRLLGRFNLDNVAAAAACAVAVGLPPEYITSGVLSLDRIPGRVERIECGQPFCVVVDYAHTDAALRQLLQSLRALTTGRLSVLFGCGGERDKGKRAVMGRVAAEHADRVILTSDNPRSEGPQAILDEIASGVAEVEGGPARCRMIVDRGEAIETAIAAAHTGDVVVLAGKGHEATLTCGDRVESFDDRVVASRALERLGWNRGARCLN